MRVGMFLAVSLSIILFAAPLYAVDMHEGRWEITVDMTMEGMNISMPPTKTFTCITKEDMVPKSEMDKNCTFKDQKISGNTVRWHVICKDKEATSEGKGEVTYSGASYKGGMKMSVTDKRGETMRMTMKMSGKRVGPCTK